MSKFKVGDKVRICAIHTGHGDDTRKRQHLNRVLTIQETLPNSWIDAYPFHVKYALQDEKTFYWFDSELCLACSISIPNEYFKID